MELRRHFYALTYLAMFAVPIWGLKRARMRAPWWVKLCAVSGLLMTILYISLSVLPIIEAGSRTIFALKLAGLITITNLVGVALFVSRGAVGTGRRGPALVD